MKVFIKKGPRKRSEHSYEYVEKVSYISADRFLLDKSGKKKAFKLPFIKHIHPDYKELKGKRCTVFSDYRGAFYEIPNGTGIDITWANTLDTN